jgi:hypothetical protein
MANTTTATKSRIQGRKSQRVKMPAVIFSVAVLMVYVGWLGRQAFSPAAQANNDLTRAHDAFYDKIAREAGPTADITKINEVDRKRFLDQVKGARMSPDLILKQYIKSHPLR